MISSGGITCALTQAEKEPRNEAGNITGKLAPHLAARARPETSESSGAKAGDDGRQGEEDDPETRRRMRVRRPASSAAASARASSVAASAACLCSSARRTWRSATAISMSAWASRASCRQARLRLAQAHPAPRVLRSSRRCRCRATLWRLGKLETLTRHRGAPTGAAALVQRGSRRRALLLHASMGRCWCRQHREQPGACHSS